MICSHARPSDRKDCNDPVHARRCRAQDYLSRLNVARHAAYAETIVFEETELSAMAFALAAAAASLVGETRSFRDWIVGCDNLGNCHATSLEPRSTPDEDAAGNEPIADNLIGMAIMRTAGPHDRPRIRFLSCYLCGPDAPEPGEVSRLAVEDASGTTVLRMRLKPSDTALLDAPDGLPVRHDAPLIDALGKGLRLTLHDRSGKELAAISLRGMSDALFFMDKEQHRQRNITALIDRGGRAAYLVPPRPPFPALSVPPASDLPPGQVTSERMNELQQITACMGSPEVEAEVTYERLDDDHTMVLMNVACASYNASSWVYVIDEKGAVQPADIRVMASASPLDLPQLVTAYWTSDDRRLHSFGRGRAFADCGQSQSFAWDGASFLLVEESRMDECRGSIDYITLYRRETVER